MREKKQKGNRLEIIMRKKLALLLAGIMVLSLLGGCGKDEENNAGETGTESQQEQNTENGTGTEESKEVVPAINLIDVKVEDYVTMGEYKNMEMSFAAKGTFTEADVDALALSAHNGYVTGVFIKFKCM